MKALTPPDAVVEIARTLMDAGFETWCVGGAVRDALLGIANQDWDLATAAPPDKMRKLFRRTVPLGMEFGTVGILDRAGTMHEVTTFRRDVKHDGRHAVVEFGASLVEDLKRRDFTINAIAYNPFEAQLSDPFNGRADLETGTVRAVGIPLERFVEDRLRVLRGIRFAARFRFAVEPVTWQAMIDSAPHLGRLSPERVKQELDKTLEQAECPSEAFVLWQRAGVFASLIPALHDLPADVLYAVDTQPRPLPASNAPLKIFRRQMRLTTLFSDCAGGEATRALKGLRAPNAEITSVATLVDRWRTIGEEMSRALCLEHPPNDAQLRRWAATIGRTRIRPFMRLARARWRGIARGESLADNAQRRAPGDDPTVLPTSARVFDTYRRMLRIVMRDAIEIADLAIDGDDLRAAGIPDGPHSGTLLREMLRVVVEDPRENQREPLLAHAVSLYQKLQRDSGS